MEVTHSLRISQKKKVREETEQSSYRLRWPWGIDEREGRVSGERVTKKSTYTLQDGSERLVREGIEGNHCAKRRGKGRGRTG
jgi:hypothetical protein